MFLHFAEHAVDNRVLINLRGRGNRFGLGIQAFYAKGEDYKPMKKGAYVEWYGEHQYKNAGRSQWPW